MANRFSDIAKHLKANAKEFQNETQNDAHKVETKVTKRETKINLSKNKSEKNKGKENETLTTRKTTLLPLVLDIAIKEAKERRNITNKINGVKKITEDNIIIEALEEYFKKAENMAYLEAAQEKINLSE